MLTVPMKLIIALLLAGALIALAIAVRTAPERAPDRVQQTDEGEDTEQMQVDTSLDAPKAQPSIDNRTPVSLDLSNRDLVSVPGDVFSRTDLERLDVSHNRLTGALQAEVRHLRNLRVLDLSDNEFTGVPAEVGQLAKLEVLDLSNNNLTGLPYELGNLKNLKTLDLSGNPNVAEQDLARIRQGLSPSVNILQ